MKTLVKQDENLTNNTNSFFESKEHYLQFIAAWRKSLADGYHERTTYTDWQGGTCKHRSQLTAVHHLVYNALRRRDLHKSFAPLTNLGKINAHYSRSPYAAYYSAREGLERSLGRWGNTDWIKRPFGDTVTDEMLIELNEALKSVEL